MRARWVTLALLVGCGGKIAGEGDADRLAGAPEPAPVATSAAPHRPQCAPPRLLNTDYGRLDVSRLGCTCSADADCAAGEWCVSFPAVDAPRCSAVTDPCELLTCERGTACIVGTDADGVTGPACVR